MSPADADQEAGPAARTPPPTLTVVKGDPTPEELAALVAVLVAATSRPDPPSKGQPHPGSGPRSGWADYGRGVRAPLAPGPGAWRAAGR